VAQEIYTLDVVPVTQAKVLKHQSKPSAYFSLHETFYYSTNPL